MTSNPGDASQGWAAPGSDGQASPGPDAAGDAGAGGAADAAGSAPTSWGPPPPGPAGAGPAYGPGYGYGQPGQAYGQAAYGQATFGQVPAGQVPYGQGYAPAAPPSYVPGPPPAPRPGIVPLRPLGMGEIFDGAFKAIRYNPAVAFGLPAIVAAVMAIATALFYERLSAAFIAPLLGDVFSTAGSLDSPWGEGPTARQLTQLAVSGVVLIIVTVIGTAIATAAVTVAAGDGVIGRKPTMAQAWKRLRGRIWAVIACSLLVTVVMILALGIVIAIMALVLSAMGDPGFAGFFIVMGAFATGVVICLVLFVKLLFTTPVIVLENAGPVRALTRSWRLVAGSFWRLTGIGMLTVLILSVASAALSYPVGTITQVIAASAGNEGAASWILAGGQALGALLQQLIILPFEGAIITLLYIDVRMRREGIELALAKAAAA